MIGSYGRALGQFTRPKGIVHDKDENLYVVDGYEIKLFSLKDAKLITRFGKNGEGPGEFPRHPRITFFPYEIFVRAMGKVLFFKRDGKYISEKKSPSL